MKVFKKRYILGLLAILVVYSIFNLLVGDSPDAYGIPRKLRHVLKFLTVGLVYAIGSLALKRTYDGWMLQLWHLVHIVLLFLLLVIGGWDWLIQPVSYTFKRLANSIQEFLISPVLYLAMGVIGARIIQQPQ